MKTIKFGIIGCGDIAFNMHMPALKKHPQAEIVAFYNRTKSKAEKACAQFGSAEAKVYDSVEAMLASDMDAIHVLTANNTHAPFSIQALKAGKHVLVEKPMATSAKAAKAMVETAQAMQKKLTVSYQNRFRGDIQKLKQLIDDGVLGDIYYIKAHALRRRGVPTWGSFLNLEIQGGGPLIDVGSHALDLALWLSTTNDIDWVMGSVYHKLKHENPLANLWGPWQPEQFKVEDAAMGFLKTRSDKTIVLESSYAINMLDENEAKLTLAGTKAGIDMVDGLRLNMTKGDQLITETIKTEANDAAYALVDDWVSAIIHDRAPLIDMMEAYRVNQVIEAIYQSAKQKTPLNLGA